MAEAHPPIVKGGKGGGEKGAIYLHSGVLNSSTLYLDAGIKASRWQARRRTLPAYLLGVRGAGYPL